MSTYKGAKGHTGGARDFSAKTLQRLAKKAGVTRISSKIVAIEPGLKEAVGIEAVMRRFTEKIMRDAAILADGDKAKVVGFKHMHQALLREGQVVYGYDPVKPRKRMVKPEFVDVE